ncbi:MAG TPA: phosphoribosylformylglycinamidine cyclo-ligase [Candidatus Mcinerneyibacteriales bacterium]|nr:phosphoribosylformylglycinamidine cyclo-ligase [Candidatus Mcinerneyibacteriales bacterium]
MKYRDAGVDIEKGNEAVRRIKEKVKTTFDANVLTDIGSFGGLYALSGYREPVLVSGTDGVGTKLKIAFLLDRHDTVGIDLVAMSVNDILVQGARPLFFLDYIATSAVEPEKIEAIVDGVIEGCRQSGCALLGGETAELPGFYAEGEYDLAGFAVGVCEKEKMVTGSLVREGDLLIGLPSSGIHSNGYSLARKVLVNERDPDESVLEELLTPTRIYVSPVLAVLEKVRIHGMVHVTGGGFYENIPRILPRDLSAEIHKGSWEIPSLFSRIAEQGEVDEEEMFTTFNMGIGLIMAVAPEDKETVMEILADRGENPALMGRIVKGAKDVKIC